MNAPPLAALKEGLDRPKRERRWRRVLGSATGVGV